MNYREAVEGLRLLADWLEKHGQSIEDAGGARFDVTVRDYPADDRKALAAYLAVPGGWEKDVNPYAPTLFWLRRQFGEVDFEVVTSREAVCTKIPTGNKVTRKVATVWDEVEEDEYRWECEPLLRAVGE